MTAEPKRISDYNACSAPAANNQLLVQGNASANYFSCNISTLFGNSNVSIVVVDGQYLRLTTHATPANSTVGGYPNNAIFFDNTHLFCVLANGHIKRVAISTF